MMDMSSMTAATATAATTGAAMVMSTSATAAAASSAATSMSMDMGGNGCKISMLWNWYTVDACFISATWRVTSPGVFAASCLGVIFLVMSLAFLRRLHRAYDASIIRSCRRRYESVTASAGGVENHGAGSDSGAASDGGGGMMCDDSGKIKAIHTSKQLLPGLGRKRARFRPSLLQQVVRASLHMMEFAVAYFIMLLAMYYNGYIIICILIGAFLGYFTFDWEDFGGSDGHNDVTEVTGCCG